MAVNTGAAGTTLLPSVGAWLSKWYQARGRGQASQYDKCI